MRRKRALRFKGLTGKPQTKPVPAKPAVGDFNNELHRLEEEAMAGLTDAKYAVEVDADANAPPFPAWPADASEPSR